MHEWDVNNGVKWGEMALDRVGMGRRDGAGAGAQETGEKNPKLKARKRKDRQGSCGGMDRRGGVEGG